MHRISIRASFLILALFCIASPAKITGPAQVTLGKARFTVITPECIRIEYSKNEKFEDAPSLFAINREARFLPASIEERSNSVVVSTDKIKLTYFDDGYPLNAYNLRAQINDAGSFSIPWTPESVNRENLGGTVATLDGALGPIPLGTGLLARDGWYILDDSKTPVLTSNWVKSRDHKENIDWYLFGYGKDYKSALKAFTEISGKIPMPRKYVLGSWYSRYWPYSTHEYKEIVDEYAQHDFPLDVMVMDMDWHRKGWTGWSWDKTLIENPKALLDWFHEQQLAVTLNDHPADGVQRHEDQYRAFMNAMGRDPSSEETLPYDAGNKTYLDMLFDTVYSPLENDGVDFWWLDWQQSTYTRSIPDLTHLAWLNRYYYQRSAAKGLRGQSFSRWGGWGDHRNPIHFSGDAHTGFPMLEFEVPMTSTAGNQGCFFWSHDIGGHVGPRDEEAFTRWVQFGATSAALRVHSSRSKDLDRRPWTYSESAEESMRRAFHLRSELFPYVYSQVWKSHSESIPLIRPLYIEYPEADEAYLNPQEYLFGDHFLVAPIVSKGAGESKVARQAVWFPEGQWYNWFTGEKFAGPKKELVTADLNEFPLYVRAGVPVVMQDYSARMATQALNTLVVRVFPDQQETLSSSFLYEDDGVTLGYLKGEQAFTQLSHMRSGLVSRVTVGKTSGAFNGQVKQRSYRFEFANAEFPTNAWVNGSKAHFSYDSSRLIASIEIDTHAVEDELMVELEFTEVSEAFLAERAFQQRLHSFQKPWYKRLIGLSGDENFEQLVESNADRSDVLAGLHALDSVGMQVKPDGVSMNSQTNKIVEIFMGKANKGAAAADIQFFDRSCSHERVLQSNTCTRNSDTTCRLSTEHLPPPQLDAHPGCTLYRKVRMNVGTPHSPRWIEETIESYPSFLSSWRVVGPFHYDGLANIASYVYEPELREIDFNKGYNVDSKTVIWSEVQADNEGIINLSKHYPYENRLAYAVTYFELEDAQKIDLSINSDDQIELFLDGKKVHSNNVHRGIDSSTDFLTLHLSKGKHVLLAKIGNYLGGWAFRIRIDTTSALKTSRGPLLIKRILAKPR